MSRQPRARVPAAPAAAPALWILLGGLVLGCSGEAVELAPDGAELEPTISISGVDQVEVGHNLLLHASTVGAVDEGYSWRSADDRIATVDVQGMLTGLFAGTVMITVTGRDTDLSAERDVIVTDANQSGP
jgi:hypothetical protein